MTNIDKELRNAVEYIQGRLYYVSFSTNPPTNNPQSNKHFFSIDNELVYWNFFLDFGPLNLGQLYRFCEKLNKKLADKQLQDKMIYFFSGNHSHKRNNAVYLLTAWSVLYQNKSPEEAFLPFKGLSPPFPAWHDATPTICTFNLTILDTLRGIAKAKSCQFFDFSKFDIEEYEHYEQVEHGDLNWCVYNRFIAFAGPHANRELSAGGYHTLTPADYLPYFKKKNVSLVVRLNKKYYEAESFTSHGIDHIDLEFLDGSNPPDHILNKFLEKCETTSGAVAVHCKAGLGRTGCCIAAYIMKHFHFTAEEVIGWLRVTRPGMVIGPQQQYLQDLQPRMWREGEIYQNKLKNQNPPLTTPLTLSRKQTSNRSVASSVDSTSQSEDSIRDDDKGLKSQGDLLRFRRQQQHIQHPSNTVAISQKFPSEFHVKLNRTGSWGGELDKQRPSSTSASNRIRSVSGNSNSVHLVGSPNSPLITNRSSGQSSSTRLTRSGMSSMSPPSSITKSPGVISTTSLSGSPPTTSTGSSTPNSKTKTGAFSSFFTSWK